MKNWCRWLMVLPLICCSCFKVTDTERVVTEFENNGTLDAREYVIPKPIFLPRYLGISGDYLYVYKDKEEKEFVLFRLSDLSYIMETGSRGQGPNDFNLLDTRSFTRTEDGFMVIEVGSGLLKDVFITEQGLRVRKSQRIFPKGAPSNGFYSLTDSLYLSFGMPNENNEFVVIDTKSGDLTPIGAYPDWEGIMQSEEFIPFFVFMKRCAVHPDKKKFATFYSKFKRFRIYDTNVNILHDVNVRTKPCSTCFYDETTKWPVYYLGEPYATQNLIFSLCSNNRTENEGNSELHIWDWEGNPVGCYSLGHSISVMTIDEQRGRVIAMNVHQDSILYVYDLPEKVIGLMNSK